MQTGMRRIVVFLLAMMAVLLGTVRLSAVKAETVEVMTEGDFKYTVSAGKAAITRYTGSAADLVIPDTLGGYPVTAIGNGAFGSNNSLTSVVIPEGVTSIALVAFWNCRSLISVEIPEGVTSIGNGAFENCVKLSSVTIPESVTSIENDAFFNCSSLTGTIVLSKNLKNFERAFNGCTKLSGISVAEDNPYYSSDLNGTVYSKTKTRLIEGSPFASSVTIPAGVRYIEVAAFSDCTNLSSVTIPASVVSIGDGAFQHCSSLRSVEIPESVTSIGAEAFLGCRILRSVDIPDGVTSIGADAFFGCYDLSSMTIPESVTSIGAGAFSGCSLSSVAIPDGVASIGDRTFRGCTNLSSVAIPDGVASIGAEAFWDCRSLRSVTIPESVTSIGAEAFFDCASLSSVEISENVTSIGAKAFSGCYDLSSVTIPESVTSIGHSAFYNCRNLTGTILLSKNITSYGRAVFGGCTKLSGLSVAGDNVSYSSDSNGNIYNKSKTTLMEGSPFMSSVTIPQSVTTIGEHAFYGCSSLNSVEIPEGVTAIEQYAFYGCSSLSSVEIPEGVTAIKQYAFYGCSGLSSVEIPEGVTAIEQYAFYYCSSLSSVTIPEGVTAIEQYAFEGCSSLSSVEIPEGVTSIGTAAFYYCNNLHFIILPTSMAEIGYRPDLDNYEGIFLYGDLAHEVYYRGSEEDWNKIRGIIEYLGSSAKIYYNFAGSEMPEIHKRETDWQMTEEKHWYECRCGRRLEAAHTEDGGTVTKEPTETEKGMKTYACTECGRMMRTEELPMLPPPHAHDYGTDWKTDAASHWKECACGEKSEEAAHTEDGGTVTKEPTETEDGIRTYACTECGRITRTESIEKHGDAFYEKGNETTAEVELPPDAPPMPEADRITSITINPAFNMKNKNGSEVELDLSKITIKAKEIYDEAGMRRAEAALGGTLNGNRHYNLLDLTLLYDGTDFSNGYEGLVKVMIPIPQGHRDKTFSCYRLTETDGRMTKQLIPGERVGDNYVIYLEHFSEYALVGQEAHAHAYGEEWKSDAALHWHECTCGAKTMEDAHAWDLGTVAKEPSIAEPGILTYRCKACGMTRTQETAKLASMPGTSGSAAITAQQKKKNGIILGSKTSCRISGASLILTWGKLSGADGYDIYAAPCSSISFELAASVGKDRASAALRRVSGRKINAKRIYKARVQAYRMLPDGTKQYIGASPDMHAAGRLNKTATNAAGISLAKKSYVVKKGSKTRLRAAIVKKDGSKGLLAGKHGAECRYGSSDEAVATVTATGQIMAKQSGTCIIYVHALNGLVREVKVTVK